MEITEPVAAFYGENYMNQNIKKQNKKPTALGAGFVFVLYSTF